MGVLGFTGLTWTFHQDIKTFNISIFQYFNISISQDIKISRYQAQVSGLWGCGWVGITQTCPQPASLTSCASLTPSVRSMSASIGAICQKAFHGLRSVGPERTSEVVSYASVASVKTEGGKHTPPSSRRPLIHISEASLSFISLSRRSRTPCFESLRVLRLC